MGPDNVAYTGDIVPEGYTQELYDFLTSVDPSFSQDLNVQQFQEALESDDNYAKSIYDFVGQHDKKFIKDVPLLDFLGSVKKKRGRRYGIRIGRWFIGATTRACY